MRVHVLQRAQRRSRQAANGVEDIVKVTIWIKALAREPINIEW
jgi:hypothetical protein